MTFDEYQQKAAEFAVYRKDREREYLSLGLISEVGELAGKLKKEIRDGVNLTEAILAEIGDCAWYLSQRCRISGLALVFPGGSSSEDGVGDASIISELADCAADLNFRSNAPRTLYLLHELCVRRGTTLEAVCEANIAKLTDRKNRGKLQGSGDTR
jgi:NTP pyrophosphatase (non-canonical NTP hydrolase)